MNEMRPPQHGPDFRSDNVGAVAPEIIEALARANRDTATGYGGDTWSLELQKRFGELFEAKVKVYPVATGTAANALAMAAITPSHGAMFCQERAHILTSEVNAVGFFSGGGMLVPVAGPHGKVDPAALEEAIAAQGKGLMHRSQPASLNIVQATDLGAVYAVDEIRALAATAKRHGLKIHMDGARFANAIARLGCKPADITSRAGVDVLSFGMTKNGGLLCDAIVVFDEAAAPAIQWHVRRAGHVWSKARFAAAQLLAYVEDDLWLRNAGRANAMAARFDAGLKTIPGASLWAPIEANEIFLKAPAHVIDGLERDGVRFFRRAADMARFVCRFDATEAEVDAVLASLRRNLSNG
ncbi:MAG: low specificity L-threonine aldolase [Alphaproteobacteria bacterium]|nr:low specificity L-threonine aldolase [Alphaproteobacteria bacterium]